MRLIVNVMQNMYEIYTHSSHNLQKTDFSSASSPESSLPTEMRWDCVYLKLQEETPNYAYST